MYVYLAKGLQYIAGRRDGFPWRTVNRRECPFKFKIQRDEITCPNHLFQSSGRRADGTSNFPTLHILKLAPSQDTFKPGLPCFCEILIGGPREHLGLHVRGDNLSKNHQRLSVICGVHSTQPSQSLYMLASERRVSWASSVHKQAIKRSMSLTPSHNVSDDSYNWCGNLAFHRSPRMSNAALSRRGTKSNGQRQEPVPRSAPTHSWASIHELPKFSRQQWVSARQYLALHSVNNLENLLVRQDYYESALVLRRIFTTPLH